MYKVEVRSSFKEISAKDKVKYKNFDEGISISDYIDKNGELIIAPDNVIELHIINDKSEDKEYNRYLVIDKENNVYTTGSDSFYESLSDIMADMAEVGEPYEIKCYKQQSKNNSGKFINCRIV